MRINWIAIVVIGTCIVLSLVGCLRKANHSNTNTRETSSAKTAVPDTMDVFSLADSTARKLTGPLQRLLKGEVRGIDSFQTQTRGDGQTAYAVLVHVADVDDLRARDLPLGSVQGGIATARWTRAEIYEAVQLSAVQRIEHAQSLSPHP